MAAAPANHAIVSVIIFISLVSFLKYCSFFRFLLSVFPILVILFDSNLAVWVFICFFVLP